MTRFTIPDMDCKSCVAAITRAITTRDPQAALSADLPSHTVEITSSLDTPTLVSLIDDAGFTVTQG